MKAITEKLVVTGVVRLAYPNLYKPRPNTLDSSKPDEYSTVVLFPKTNTDFQPNAEQEIKDMKHFMSGIAKNKFGVTEDGKVVVKVKVNYALKDGDVEVNQKGELAFPGYYFIRCNAPCMFKSGDSFKPNVFDGRKRLMESGGKSGDWGIVVMDIFPWKTPTGQGVTTRLKEVQFLFEDEPIGNVMVAGSAFEEVPTAHAISPVMSISSENLGYVDPAYDPHADTDENDPFL
jgi:hypothetical protein